MNVGLGIKDYMLSSGRTQTYISRRTGIPISKLNLALNGKRKLNLEEYELICGALGVSVDRFLTPRVPEQAS